MRDPPVLARSGPRARHSCAAFAKEDPGGRGATDKSSIMERILFNASFELGVAFIYPKCVRHCFYFLFRDPWLSYWTGSASFSTDD